jgi:hypothetical protein
MLNSEAHTPPPPSISTSNTGRAVVVGEYAGADSTIVLRLDERVDVLKKSGKVATLLDLYY